MSVINIEHDLWPEFHSEYLCVCTVHLFRITLYSDVHTVLNCTRAECIIAIWIIQNWFHLLTGCDSFIVTKKFLHLQFVCDKARLGFFYGFFVKFFLWNAMVLNIGYSWINESIWISQFLLELNQFRSDLLDSQSLIGIMAILITRCCKHIKLVDDTNCRELKNKEEHELE